MIDISKAEIIDGWMSTAELTWLANQASNHRTIVEIGSWMGKSTSAIANHMPTGGIFYAVDSWKGDESIAKSFPNLSPEWLLDKFKTNLKEELAAGKVRICSMLSVEAAVYLSTTLGLRFDMIFIDAAHDYDNVKADILAWLPLLKDGGIICGHDWHPLTEGVIRAVTEIIPTGHPVADLIWCS